MSSNPLTLLQRTTLQRMQCWPPNVSNWTIADEPGVTCCRETKPIPACDTENMTASSLDLGRMLAAVGVKKTVIGAANGILWCFRLSEARYRLKRSSTSVMIRFASTMLPDGTGPDHDVDMRTPFLPVMAI